MPTAARLVAGVLLAILAWILSDLVRPLMPEGTAFGWFNYVNAFIGLWVGWVVMGRRAGRGFVQGINNGLTGVVMLFLWCLAAHSCWEMFRLAMRNRYDGPMEAITAIFLIGSEFGVMIATAPVLGTALVGALIIGPAADFAAKHWR
ncbi:TrgA family protein [Sulfitobacter donghicola]|uniref:Tellurium resistance protein n=1 Tax=Sulfitobacter donghicola DSW-25 = KCTC 12864 = JCM 14565 TaxID=1300350 RepID=A0A073IE53_9RHOB|nr:TrgA family protein [Sulfitobacter donghicola]KEJ87999.1 tellurium resistance protein [Sulfitobacter donghicola DSW-25 = KCTC 12864 = JCM 14565]KIN69511.1 Tellurite resistance protein [Sulfitobacter donghicola DSW-25 = KCTC 12864 = JCM 14565]